MSSKGTTPPYVLYVGSDKRDSSQYCPGGRQAIKTIDNAGLSSFVLVQTVDAVKKNMDGKLPDWLSATPTLVCRSSRRAMRGKAVITYLSKLAAKVGKRVHAEVGQRDDHHGVYAEEGGGVNGGGDENHEEPLGILGGPEARFLKPESNFEAPADFVDNVGKYSDERKITDTDLEALIARRGGSSAGGGGATMGS